MGFQSTWTDERRALVTKLWADGSSASQIAKELGGVSRNAVIGVIHRMKNAGKELPVRVVRKEKIKAKPVPRQRRTAFKLNAHAAFEAVSEFEEVASVDDQQIPIEQRKTLIELENCHCRWPVGEPGKEDFFFCGDATADVVAGKPYCTWHTKRSISKSGTTRSRQRQADNTFYIPRRRAA